MEDWGCPLSSLPNLHIQFAQQVSLGVVCEPCTRQMTSSFWVVGLLQHCRRRFRQDPLTQWVAVPLMTVTILGGLNVAEPLFLIQMARDVLLLTRHSRSRKGRMMTGYSGQRTVYHSRVLNHAQPILPLMRMTAWGNSKRAEELFLLQMTRKAWLPMRYTCCQQQMMMTAFYPPRTPNRAHSKV
jgi:hypothetical protein